MEVKRYSENPNKYWPLIEKFRLKSFKEGNDSIKYELYNPDNPSIETWMCFKDNELISISAGEKSHYTNDPNIALRVCRYHILKSHRFTHCGLIMGEHQIKWAREKGYKILYITHDITKTTINMLYQRRKKMTVPSFKEHTKGEWYNNLQLEKDFLFKTGDMLQYVYSIRLQGDYDWQPKSDFIIMRKHDGKIYE
jgi:hypothetical protein